MKILENIKSLLGKKPKDLFIKKNALFDKQEEVVSPSGKYGLIITPYTTGKGCWNYTLGEVFVEDQLIALVKRNYSSFPYAWVEAHANGHDYLVCGENYQGQTIIELDTGKRIDYLPEMAKLGGGFCWTDIVPSFDGNLLAVVGCYWGSPYEVVIYDFSNPMDAPWIILNRDIDNDTFVKWIDNTSCEIGRAYEFSKVYNKREKDLTEEELIDTDDREAAGEKYSNLWEFKTDSIVWTRKSDYDVLIAFLNDELKWYKDHNEKISPDKIAMLMKMSCLNCEDSARFRGTKELEIYDWALCNIFNVEEFKKEMIEKRKK